MHFHIKRLTGSILGVALTMGCKPLRQDGSASSLKIVGGENVLSAADPLYSSTISLGGCTGTLIGPNHIVTAAHCVSGPSSFDAITYGPNGNNRIATTKITSIAHPRYSEGAFDIAVVAFMGMLPPDLRPVRIASLGAIGPGAPLIFAGYGVTGEGKDDGGILRKTQSTVGQIQPNVREFSQVSGRGTGTCYGDSGGPAYVIENGGLALAGVTSRGDNCDSTDGIYTDARLFQGWMKCTFQSLGAPIPTLLDDASLSECNGGGLAQGALGFPQIGGQSNSGINSSESEDDSGPE